MIILVDVDGVLTDFVELAVHTASVRLGRQITSSANWDFFSHLPKEEADAAWATLDAPGLCSCLTPYPEALEAIKYIRSFAKVVAVTAPLKVNPTWSYDRGRWLKGHFGITEVVHTKQKQYVHGDYFIDDKVENIETWSQQWCWDGLNFDDSRGLLFDTEYNRGEAISFGTRVYNWNEIITALEKHV